MATDIYEKYIYDDDTQGGPSMMTHAYTFSDDVRQRIIDVVILARWLLRQHSLPVGQHAASSPTVAEGSFNRNGVPAHLHPCAARLAL